ncbi:MAG TPA: transcription termination factor Rho, partial [Bacteroidia bacterium]|nr:transcription termination factor Rho [Bacteroidia bacterium]
MNETESFAETGVFEDAAPPAPRKRAPRKTAPKADAKPSARRSAKQKTEKGEKSAPVEVVETVVEASPAPIAAPVAMEAPPVVESPAPAPAPARSEEGGAAPGESGRRRNQRKRKRKNRESSGNAGNEAANPSEDDEVGELSADDGVPDEGPNGEPRVFKSRKQRFLERKEKERARELAALEASPAVESEGIVEISPKGFGFLRERIRGFQQSPKDVFITPEVVRIYGLRDGLMVRCVSKQGVRGPQLIELLAINGRPPEESTRLPYFEELTAVNPNKKLTLETDSNRFTTRVIDLVSPIGRGQRGLIVAPPRTGKTTFLHHIAEGILKNYEDEIHLMVLLVDERPEEVTDFERSFPGVEIFSSSNDSEAKDHTRIALLAIERAKRLVEGGQHVVMLMDSITRLARAFNSQMRGGGKRGTASGGLIVGALEVPRRIFAAARNTREAGSLTIIATALVQTNSKADEAIFQEFKGTGNMELVLDRQLSQSYVYPAVDINKSGTRREELLLPPHVLEKIYVIRRGLSGYRPVDAMEWLLKCMHR